MQKHKGRGPDVQSHMQGLTNGQHTDEINSYATDGDASLFVQLCSLTTVPLLIAFQLY